MRGAASRRRASRRACRRARGRTRRGPPRRRRRATGSIGRGRATRRPGRRAPGRAAPAPPASRRGAAPPGRRAAARRVAKEGLLLTQTHVPIEAKAATLHAVAVEPVVGILGIPPAFVLHKGVALALPRPPVHADGDAPQAAAFAKVVRNVSLTEIVRQIANEQRSRIAQLPLAHIHRSSPRWRAVIAPVVATIVASTIIPAVALRRVAGSAG